MPLFRTITKLFCEKFCRSVRLMPSATGDNVHDYGWFDMLESTNAEDQAEVASFRRISKWLLPYSPNESYFGQYDHKMTRNAEVRLDGIAAQTTAQSNGSFSNINLNKLALLVIRKFVKSKRKKVREALVDAKDAAADRKLFLRSQKVVARLLKDRADHARAIIEWDVEPHHTADFIKRNRGHPDLDPSHLSIEDELKAGASDKHRKEVLKQNYHCITTGWGYSQYKCCFSGTSTCSLCKCCCGGDSVFKKGGHMEVRRA